MNIKRGFFIIILAALFLPKLQQETQWIEQKPLNGVYDLGLKPEAFIKNWLSGESQEAYSQYFNENIGLRPFLIRVYNQYRFSFYKAINKNDAILGKENILYDKRYISSTLGDDFLGRKTIKKKVLNINFVKNKMEKEGKRLLIIIAPNKARYFSEEVPKHFKKKDTTNYKVFLEEFKKKKIDFIDFNDWFVNKRKNINLIPKYGIHWSVFGAQLATDSIIKFCNKHYKYNLPMMMLDSFEISTIPRVTDFDLGDNLNLLKKFDDEIYLYPYTRVLATKNTKKKNLLVVSDSFFGAFHRSDFSSKVFNMTGYWYYNKEVRSKNQFSRPKNSKDFNNAFPQTDIVIIMLTEWNLYRLGFGIIEELKSYYEGGGELSEYDLNVIYYLDRIRRDKEWMSNLESKAIQLNISVDSCLTMAAHKWANIKIHKDNK